MKKTESSLPQIRLDEDVVRRYIPPEMERLSIEEKRGYISKTLVYKIYHLTTESTISDLKTLVQDMGKIGHYDPVLLKIMADRKGTLMWLAKRDGVTSSDGREMTPIGKYYDVLNAVNWSIIFSKANDPGLLEFILDKRQDSLSRMIAISTYLSVGNYDKRLLQLLRDDNEQIRSDGVTVLSHYNEIDDEPMLEDMIKDEVEHVRECAQEIKENRERLKSERENRCDSRQRST